MMKFSSFHIYGTQSGIRRQTDVRQAFCKSFLTIKKLSDLATVQRDPVFGAARHDEQSDEAAGRPTPILRDYINNTKVGTNNY